MDKSLQHTDIVSSHNYTIRKDGRAVYNGTTFTNRVCILFEVVDHGNERGKVVELRLL